MTHQTIKIISLLILAVFMLGACVPANQITTDIRIETAVATNVTPDDTEEILEDTDEINPAEEPSKTTDPTPTSTEPDESDLETNIPNNTLTEDEIASLVFMREEEKLAHDVYLGLYDLWGLSIFQNIAGSEQTHTDAVKRLLDIYDIEDPAEPSPTGIFVNVELQALYNELTALGAQSLGDALKVGGAIEEIDIWDLQRDLENTQNDDVRRVYENLLRGSKNHLRAFTSTLERQTAELYQPQYLTQADYDAILTSNAPKAEEERAIDRKIKKNNCLMRGTLSILPILKKPPIFCWVVYALSGQCETLTPNTSGSNVEPLISGTAIMSRTKRN